MSDVGVMVSRETSLDLQVQIREVITDSSQKRTTTEPSEHEDDDEDNDSMNDELLDPRDVDAIYQWIRFELTTARPKKRMRRLTFLIKSGNRPSLLEFRFEFEAPLLVQLGIDSQCHLISFV